MASRAFKPASKRLYINAKTVVASFTVGATGAVGTVSGKGVTSIVWNSTGQYTVTLTDKYAYLVFPHVQLLHTAATNAYAVIESEDVAGSTPTIVVQFYNIDDDTALDPPENSIMYLKFDLCDSSLGYA